MKHVPTTLTILLLLLTACVGHNPPTARGATPEEAASKVIPIFRGSSPSFTLLGTHVTPYGMAVFYTKDPGGPAESSSFGFVLAEQRGRGWVTRDIHETPASGHPFVHDYVFVAGTVHNLNGRVGSTWGRALKPDVAAVEVMFNDGHIVRDTITPDGLFIVMADDTFTYCMVKVLDAQDHVLETIHAEAANGCSKE